MDRGMITRGFEQGTPGSSSMCSHIRALLLGAASMFRKSNGWDGLADNNYQNTAVALETTSVCEIPFEQLDHLASSITSIQNYTTKLMSREIINGQRLIALLAGNSAHQRLASLLISLSDRLALQKLSSTGFRLPMSRGDISNYLGLTVETVSRTFSYFQKMGYLRVNKKEVELLNLDALQEVIADSDVFA